MGLTAASTGVHAVDSFSGIVRKETEQDIIIALAGNPNVGKSTVFNELTGMNQHTGNWPGKTVSTAQGRCSGEYANYIIVDLPGTYSLMAHSAEEEVARDFICFGGADAVAVVCDATCLERNLNLVLQTIEITPNVVVCINLMDEAEKKHIHIDLKKLQAYLGVPVVGTSARSGKGLQEFLAALQALVTRNPSHLCPGTVKIRYTAPIEQAVTLVENAIYKITSRADFISQAFADPLPQTTREVDSYQADRQDREIGANKIGSSVNYPRGKFSELSARWTAIKLIDYDAALGEALDRYYGMILLQEELVAAALREAWEILHEAGITHENLRDRIVSCIVLMAEEACLEAVTIRDQRRTERERKLDKILTSRITGIPIMLLLLCGIFWLTITGANYPSQLLSEGLFWIQDRLTEFFHWLGTPEWVHGALVLGVYRVLAWVVSVMLPPMAIFFPLFTLLEDFGYFPRVAFNLDHHFKKAKACGKQALTMCMGFGCNAAGVVGCRIIDSPRERLIAILTNNFVPCNGRFPVIISIISMFFLGTAAGLGKSVLSAAILLCVVLFGIFMTFVVSRLLSGTILKGIPSSFTLELPPFRRPQIGKVIVRSLCDRTLFVLGRAAAVAAPAGLIIWIMANVQVGGASLLAQCAGFLDPFTNLLGLDGVILMAFILGIPANEIVFPIIIMAYMSTGSIIELENLSLLKELLMDNGWTWVTAVSTMLFCLLHWPCSTTCMTIKKETQSKKWTVAAFLLPTVICMIVCFFFTSIVRLIGIG